MEQVELNEERSTVLGISRLEIATVAGSQAREKALLGGSRACCRVPCGLALVSNEVLEHVEAKPPLPVKIGDHLPATPAGGPAVTRTRTASGRDAARDADRGGGRQERLLHERPPTLPDPRVTRWPT